MSLTLNPNIMMPLRTISKDATPEMQEELAKQNEKIKKQNGQALLAYAVNASMRERKTLEQLLDGGIKTVSAGKESSVSGSDHMEKFFKNNADKFCKPLFPIAGKPTLEGFMIQGQSTGCYRSADAQRKDPYAPIVYYAPCKDGDIETFAEICLCVYVAMECGTETIPTLQVYTPTPFTGLVGSSCTPLCLHAEAIGHDIS